MTQIRTNTTRASLAAGLIQETQQKAKVKINLFQHQQHQCAFSPGGGRRIPISVARETETPYSHSSIPAGSLSSKGPCTFKRQSGLLMQPAPYNPFLKKVQQLQAHPPFVGELSLQRGAEAAWENHNLDHNTRMYSSCK